MLNSLLYNENVWVQNIFPFLGPGHFLYVALVCKWFQHHYMNYVGQLDPKEWKSSKEWKNSFSGFPVTATFYRVAFSSLSCAQFWNQEYPAPRTEIYILESSGLGFPWSQAYLPPKNSKNLLRADQVCAMVAKYGNLEVLKWARSVGFPWSTSTISAAAGKGHLEIVEYALSFRHDPEMKNRCPAWWQDVCAKAARGGHLAIVQYFHEHDYPWDGDTCVQAARCGHLEVLTYAIRNGCPWNQYEEYTSAEAAFGGHLEILKYLHEIDCPWDERTCKYAAKNGHLDCIVFAREKRCPWDSETCSFAAENGHLEILEFAHENGCPWDNITCLRAVEGGFLECLQYALDNGCPWHEKTCFLAAARGHLGCLVYALDKDCPWDAHQCLQLAQKGRHSEVEQWILQVLDYC